MKHLCFLILMISFLCTECSSINTDYSKLYGFWEKEMSNASGSQKFVLYFAKGKDGLMCQFHSYLNGVKFSPEIGTDINFDGKNLSFIANQVANVRYEGTIDTLNGTIIGKLGYSDGSSMDFSLKRISKDQLAERYPGLLNLNEDARLIKQPEEVKGGWDVGKLSENNIDSALLHTMVDSINNGNFGRVHSVLIAKNGKLVFEKYFEGFYLNDLNSLQSCTKSIGSLLIGLAIDKGYIKSVDEKLIDFFPAYKVDVGEEWNKVELKHLLSQSTGIDWKKDIHDKIYQISNDVIETTFEQKFSHAPGKIFEYRNPQIDLLSGIIIKSSEISVQDFAEKYLFKPLNIFKYSWTNFKKTNYPLMSGSLALSSRDMLKIGQLVLNEGKWNGEQVISKKWIDEATSFKIKSDQTFDYGYLWWLGESKNKPDLKVIFAMGGGGQFIIIVPKTNLVVAITADNMDRDTGILLTMVDDYIINSIK